MSTYVKMSNITSQFWSEAEFEQSRDSWNELLSNSDADPVFMSWDWLHSWWRAFRYPKSQLRLIAVYDEQTLIGLAPLYIEKDRFFKGIFPTNRLQFLGKRYAGEAGTRTEYVDFILRKGRQKLALKAIFKAIEADFCWSEFILGDFNGDSQNFPLIKEWFNRNGWYGVHEGASPTFTVNCKNSFETYLQGLGKNTRLKLFNRRKKLQQMGKVSLTPITADNFVLFSNLLNQFHLKRWQSPALDHDNLAFFRDALGFDYQRLKLDFSSILMLDERPLSVMVNVNVDNVVYNIQLGYEETFDPKISLGTLHLGYALEQAFNHPQITTFDFLVGQGKHTDYKRHLSKKATLLETSRWFRRLPQKPMFQLRDLLFGR